MGRYIPSTGAEQQEMLRSIGLDDFRQLYKDVPEQMYLERGLDIPAGMSELEAAREMSAMAAENKVFPTVLRGAGAYDHYIPSIVKYIPAKEEFLTAYTPYQAELSQGILQSIFEYQSMICALTGMDVSNASGIRWRYRRRRGRRHVPRQETPRDADIRLEPPGHNKHGKNILLRHERRA